MYMYSYIGYNSFSQVLKTLIALKKGGVAFIIISHRDSYVKELGFDRSLVLRQMRQSFPEVQT